MQRTMYLLLLWYSLIGLALTPATSEVNTTTTITAAATITKPGCQRQCGNLTVPYPFGIGINSGCSIGPWFDVNCNSTSFNPPRAFIGQIRVYNISDSQLRVSNVMANKCYNQSGALLHENSAWTNLETTPYSFSEANVFTVIGCDEFALITGRFRNLILCHVIMVIS